MMHDDTLKKAVPDENLQPTTIDKETTDRIQSYKEREKSWKKDVARRLEEWRLSHGYATKLDFAAAMDVPRHVYVGVSLEQIISSPEMYARMHLFTGIVAVNPINVPPRLIKIPNGSYSEQRRNWTLAEWNAWHAENKGMYKLPAMPSISDVQTPIPSPAQVPLQTPVGDMSLTQKIEDLLGAFSETVALRVAQELKQENHPFVADMSRVDIQQLITSFAHLLRSFMNGTVQDRQTLVSQHGKALSELLPLLEVLTIPDQEKREQRIRMLAQFDGKAG
jgi:hypothetical protein